MRIIDEDGRIFKTINIIDLLFLILVFVITYALCEGWNQVHEVPVINKSGLVELKDNKYPMDWIIVEGFVSNVSKGTATNAPFIILSSSDYDISQAGFNTGIAFLLRNRNGTYFYENTPLLVGNCFHLKTQFWTGDITITKVSKEE
jgi:hypothetical protein